MKNTAPEAGPEPAIEAKDVCFGYSADEVLHNVTFSIPQRARVAVVGPNGGGKTTLVRLILGECKPRFGSVSVFGREPVASRNRVGLVPQEIEYNFNMPISALEVVMTGRASKRIFGGFNRGDRENAFAALELVGMANRANKLFADLSGGQRQRVIIARALCGDPDLLVLDEPTANVDSKTKHSIHELFNNLFDTKTVVTVSHNPGIVMSQVTHVLCVNRTVDIHDLSGSDKRAVLEEIPGESGLSVVHPSTPVHMEELFMKLSEPHHGA